MGTRGEGGGGGEEEGKKVTNDVPRSRGNNIVGLAWVFDNDSEPIIATSSLPREFLVEISKNRGITMDISRLIRKIVRAKVCIIGFQKRKR